MLECQEREEASVLGTVREEEASVAVPALRLAAWPIVDHAAPQLLDVVSEHAPHKRQPRRG